MCIAVHGLRSRAASGHLVTSGREPLYQVADATVRVGRSSRRKPSPLPRGGSGTQQDVTEDDKNAFERADTKLMPFMTTVATAGNKPLDWLWLRTKINVEEPILLCDMNNRWETKPNIITMSGVNTIKARNGGEGLPPGSGTPHPIGRTARNRNMGTNTITTEMGTMHEQKNSVEMSQRLWRLLCHNLSRLRMPREASTKPLTATPNNKPGNSFKEPSSMSLRRKNSQRTKVKESNNWPSP